MTLTAPARLCYILSVGVIVPLLLAGCTATEPYQQPYLWSQTGANAANLAAMVEVPADLVRGRAFVGTDAIAADNAVSRLSHDRVKSLMDTATTAASSAGSGTGGGASSSQGN